MKEVMTTLKTNRLLRWQIGIFIFLSLSLIVTNGLTNCWWGTCGLSIGQWHMHDALWHVSMAKIAFRSWPFTHPFYAGAPLVGYNYGLDLILFGLTKIGLSPLLSFFQILPTLAAILYVGMVVIVTQKSAESRSEQNATAFFLFFGNSFAYLATLWASHTLFYASLRGFPVVTSIQPTMMFLNVQYALSLPVLLMGIYLIKHSSRVSSVLWLIALAAVITGLKFYGGVVFALVTGGMITVRLVQREQVSLRLLQLLGLALGLALARLLFYAGAGGDGFPFAFAPLAIAHVLIDDPLLFYNHSWTLARYYLYEHGGLRSPRLLALESWTLLLFALMNFGTRLIGLGVFLDRKLRTHLSTDDLIITFVAATTFAIPVFFVQDGGWYNTMQFLYYGIFLASFPAGKVVSALATARARRWGRSIVVILILLTLPNAFEQLRFLTAAQNVIPASEVAVLTKLAKAPQGTVYISNPEYKNAVVPALSGKTAYYLDVDQLMVTHVDYQARQREMRAVNPQNVASLPVDYFYIYRRDEGGEALIAALEKAPHITKFAATADLVVFQR